MKKIALLLFWIINPIQAQEESSFSAFAWKTIATEFKQIKEHPFNVELADGTLNPEKFKFYKAQDKYYLKRFTEALSGLAMKFEDAAQRKILLKQALGCISEAGEDTKPEADFSNITPSNFSYTNYLLSLAAYGSKEELAAALLPCYWIYLKLARELKLTAKPDSPYYSWIEFYSSKDYEKDVQLMINLTNKLALSADKKMKDKMLIAFRLATKLEFEFWNDSYFLKKLI